MLHIIGRFTLFFIAKYLCPSIHKQIKAIPWTEFGIVIGAGVFQHWQTSKGINRNFGFQLEVRFNF
ncbi:hypothetical protein [Psychroflexus torquis]|uniref:hypothetical protein n=1 Tax=Psychroflexus torquis TaxID=57029 RepID=UPI0000D540D6|nr:hypothetical protein [Psychroflexus torquis]